MPDSEAIKRQLPLIRALSDGRFHSGTELAAQLGVSRTAIWKQVRGLRENHGLQVSAVTGRGYRLSRPVDMLDEDKIRDQLGVNSRARLADLTVLAETTSSNDFLQGKPMPAPGDACACVTEYQTAGRGRRGRQWLSGFAQNLLLSIAWRFELPLSGLSGLSIALGTGIAEWIAQLGVREVCLKWPNDLHVHGRKLAGILVDADGELQGPSRAVIGIGMNLQGLHGETPEQPWTSLQGELGSLPPRNEMCAMLLNTVMDVCAGYAKSGLSPFVRRWAEFDCYQGAEVDLVSPDKTVSGVYSGIDATGGVILDLGDKRQIFFAGEVSLRPRK